MIQHKVVWKKIVKGGSSSADIKPRYFERAYRRIEKKGALSPRTVNSCEEMTRVGRGNLTTREVSRCD